MVVGMACMVGKERDRGGPLLLHQTKSDLPPLFPESSYYSTGTTGGCGGRWLSCCKLCGVGEGGEGLFLATEEMIPTPPLRLILPGMAAMSAPRRKRNS